MSPRGRLRLAVYTRCTGRWLYLRRLLESLDPWSGADHRIFVQHGVALPDSMECFIKACGASVVTVPKVTQAKATIIGQNWAIRNGARLIMQLDDDAIARTPNFFHRIWCLHKALPGTAFSPAPVGLFTTSIRSNDKTGKDRQFVYEPYYDTFYAYRQVGHIGGFARVVPTKIASLIKIDHHAVAEDSAYSELLQKRKVKMAYLDSGIIVEHQETSRGQQLRAGKKRMA